VPEESYGINLAVIAGLPGDLLDEAKTVRDKVRDSKLKALESVSEIEVEATSDKRKLQLFARLVEASMSSNPSVLKSYLQGLQKQFLLNENRED
jgi:DNA mismatch repair ATPase MutS